MMGPSETTLWRVQKCHDAPGDTIAAPSLNSEEGIQEWLIHRVADIVAVDPADIDPIEPFDVYGLESAEAVGLSGELEEWLGIRLPAVLVYTYPTIEVLSRHLAGLLRAS
jgi:acyl carrier protein